MNIPINNLYQLKLRTLWRAFLGDNFAFWMSCAYLFFEYVRPQSIWSFLNVYPYWARTFIILAFLGWLIDPKRRFVWNRITTGIFIFLYLIILSSIFAYWPEISWNSFMNYFNWVVVYFVLTQTVTTRQRFFIFLVIFFLCSFKLSIYGARTWVLRGFSYADWGLAGPEGFFENPGELAIQMLVFAPIAIFFSIGIKSFLKRWQSLLFYLMPITAALTILGTNTRGSQLAMVGQFFALIMMMKQRVKLLIVILFIGFIGYQLIPPEQMKRFQEVGKDGTSKQRLLYWGHGWQMIKDNPILGVGFFNFAPYYDRYYPEDLELEFLKGAQLPHNIFIQVGTDTGFPGIAVFVYLIWAGFNLMRKLGKTGSLKRDSFILYLTKGMNLALLGYVVAGQFVTVAYYPFLWIHLAMVTIITTFWNDEQQETNKS